MGGATQGLSSPLCQGTARAGTAVRWTRFLELEDKQGKGWFVVPAKAAGMGVFNKNSENHGLMKVALSFIAVLTFRFRLRKLRIHS